MPRHQLRGDLTERNCATTVTGVVLLSLTDFLYREMGNWTDEVSRVATFDRSTSSLTNSELQLFTSLPDIKQASRPPCYFSRALIVNVLLLDCHTPSLFDLL
jgi:hypothetical protein